MKKTLLFLLIFINMTNYYSQITSWAVEDLQELEYTEVNELNTLNEERKKLYEYWKRIHTISIEGLKSPSEPFVYKSAIHYTNLLHSYMASFPKDKHVVKRIFLRALAYDPIYRCENWLYGEGNQKFVHVDGFEKYFKHEREFMTNICHCILEQLDSKLIEKLKKIEMSDQKYRGDSNFLVSKDKQLKQAKLDSLNLIDMKKIIDLFGYPGRNLVGTENENIAFLILQHSDIKTMKAYLGIVEEAVKNRILLPKAYAYLYDRINILEGKEQYYGTQSYFDEKAQKIVLEPTKDEKTLNWRRYKMLLKMYDHLPKPEIQNSMMVSEK